MSAQQISEAAIELKKTHTLCCVNTSRMDCSHWCLTSPMHHDVCMQMCVFHLPSTCRWQRPHGRDTSWSLGHHLSLRQKPRTSAVQVNVLQRKAFFMPSFEIYGSVAGFYDYGPNGCKVKQNVTQFWRQHFVLHENMQEASALPCIMGLRRSAAHNINAVHAQQPGSCHLAWAVLMVSQGLHCMRMRSAGDNMLCCTQPQVACAWAILPLSA